MELRHLRYFLAVAEELNFTRAAARLGIGQPPLSQQIKDLEQELGTALFRRTPHGAELTAAGVAFLPEARLVLGSAARARALAQRAGRGESGQLRIGFSGSAAFNPLVSTVIRNFRRAYPDVQLTLIEMNTTGLLEMLAQQTLDVGFVRPGPNAPTGMDLQPMADEAMKIVLPNSHRFASRRHLSLAELAGEPFVLFPRGVGLSLHDEIVDACRRAGFELIVSQEVPQISSVVNLVAAEFGVSVVPASISQFHMAGVCYLDIDDAQPPVARMALATRPGQDAPSAHNFLALAAKVPSANLPE
ncbi:LysR family transcriptional regulator [Pigmentiphaga aceris]|uniref:LysR family transcriptional regulator n=1 Tax=Pigmentiphaga aceris TaxID=1940612 RepID=A0A5C0AXR0_9BURK|nr:LysR family transcriptional regulator [Pigmentiphaga aceris]QEI06526.1 LysR family transcriptional regulator [Pigmentiphaga aceris]